MTPDSQIQKIENLKNIMSPFHQSNGLTMASAPRRFHARRDRQLQRLLPVHGHVHGPRGPAPAPRGRRGQGQARRRRRRQSQGATAVGHDTDQGVRTRHHH